MQRKLLLASVLGWTLASPAIAGTYEWTAGWGMGVSEYSVDDGNGNGLLISCPNHQDDGFVSAYATIYDQSFSSEAEGPEQFDVIVDGEVYSNPFYTDCRVCGANFAVFWEALRNANNLKISADDVTVRLPTDNLSSVLHPLDSELNACRSAW